MMDDADADAISAARYAAMRSGDYVMRDCRSDRHRAKIINGRPCRISGRKEGRQERVAVQQGVIFVQHFSQRYAMLSTFTYLIMYLQANPLTVTVLGQQKTVTESECHSIK